MCVVGTPDAALFLRKHRVALPLLLVGTWLPEQLPFLLRANVTPTLFSLDSARQLESAARRRRQVATCHLRVDTCDCGTGLDPRELPQLVASLPSLPHVRVEAIYTHLFSSYTDPAATTAALAAFDALFASLPASFRRRVFRHAANSPAIFNHPQSRYQMVRPGNALYGLPFNGPDLLQPCLAIKGRVTQIRETATPWKLGYHARAHAARRLAIVPAGASQAPWLLAHENTDALIRGQRAKLLSSGMEYLYLDISRIPDAQPGDEVVFLGKQGNDQITVRELMKKTAIDLTHCERLCMTEE
jgi:alanine racemase